MTKNTVEIRFDEEMVRVTIDGKMVLQQMWHLMFVDDIAAIARAMGGEVKVAEGGWEHHEEEE